MNKKELELRIARLEKLLAKSKSVKNEDFDDDDWEEAYGDDMEDQLNALINKLNEAAEQIYIMADMLDAPELHEADDKIYEVINLVKSVLEDD